MTKKQRPSWNFRRLIKILGVIAVAAVGILMVVSFYLNGAAERQLVEQIVAATGLAAQLGSATIGPSGLVAHELVLGEVNNPIFTAKKVTIGAPLTELVSKEPTIHALRIEGATLRLNATRDGELDWPFQGEGARRLPSRYIELFQAKVVVTQPGRLPLVIEGINLTLDNSFDDRIQLEGDVDQFLRSRWEITGDGEHGGKIRVNLNSQHVSLHSENISRLPLVPTGVDRVAFEVSGGMSLQLVVKNGARGFNYQLQFSHGAADFPAMGIHFSDADASILGDGRSVSIESWSATIGAGRVSGAASFDDLSTGGDFRGTIRDVALENFRSLFDLPEYADGEVSVDLSGRLSVNHAGAVRIGLLGSGTVTNALVHGIHAKSAKLDISIDEFTRLPSGEKQLRGELKLRDLEVVDVPIRDVMKEFQVPGDVASSVEGTFSAKGTLTFPLATVGDISTWTAKAQLTTDELISHGLRLSKAKALLAMQGGTLHFDQLTANLGDDAIVTGSVHWPLSADQPVEINLRGDVPAEQLVKANVNATDHPHLDGRLSILAAFQMPASSLLAREEWTGKVSISSHHVSWEHVTANALTLDANVANGDIVLNDLTAKFSNGGELSVKGSIPLRPGRHARIRLYGKQLGLARHL